MTTAVLVAAVIVLAAALVWALGRASLYKRMWEGERSLNDALIRGEDRSESAAEKLRSIANGDVGRYPAGLDDRARPSRLRKGPLGT